MADNTTWNKYPVTITHDNGSATVDVFFESFTPSEDDKWQIQAIAAFTWNETQLEYAAVQGLVV